MCPLCVTSALLIAGGSVSTGGIATVVYKRLSGKKSADPSASSPSKEEHHG